MITLSSFKLTSLLNNIESKIENNYLEGVEVFAKDSHDSFAFEKGIFFASAEEKIYKSCSTKYTWFFKARTEEEIVQQLRRVVAEDVKTAVVVEEEELEKVEEVEVEPVVKTVKKKVVKNRKKKVVKKAITNLKKVSKPSSKSMIKKATAKRINKKKQVRKPRRPNSTKTLGYRAVEFRKAPTREDFHRMVEENIKIAKLTERQAEKYRVCANKYRIREGVVDNRRLFDKVQKIVSKTVS